MPTEVLRITPIAETPPVAGPRLIGALAAIGKGAYTEIVSITAPASAVAGSLVQVVARVKNLASYAIYIAVSGRYDGKDFVFKPEYANVGAGVTTSFTFSFVMLAKNVRVDAWSYYWTGSAWVLDDQAYVNIAVEIPLKGTIVKKQLEYAGKMVNIPAADVPLDTKSLVHIWGRNDTSQNQKLGLSWNIRAPDGKIVEEGYDWESLYTGPGGQHHFIIPPGALDYLYLNKAGKYTIGIGLSMNPADPTLVDSYSGTLCTVVAPVVTGKIEDPRVKYNLSYVAIPVDEMPFGENFRIAFYGRNTSDINLTLGADIKIYDSDGKQVFCEEDWETAWTGPGGTHNFKWPKAPLATIPVNKFGVWKTRMRLFCDIGEPVAKLLDDITKVIFTVEEERYAGRITDKKVDWTDLPGGEVDFPMTEPAPLGERIRVSALGWNDSATTMKLRGEVWIYSPSEKLFYHGADVSTLSYSPGTAHKFIFPKPPFATDKLEKAGAWTIRMELTDSSGEYLLAEYEGPLFTVEAPEELYLGRIASVLVDLKPLWPGGEHSVPYTEEAVPIGQKYHISFEGYNESDFWMRLKGMVWIISPTGREYYLDDVSTAPYAPGTAHEFIFQQFPAADEEGSWAIRIELRNSTGEFLLDEFESTLFIAGVLPEAFGSIGGRVTDAKTGDPIEGAVVWVAGQSGTTDSSGDYTIADVPVGTWTVAAGAEGYESAKESIEVSEGVTTTVDFILEPSKVGIPDWLIVGGAIGGLAAAAGGVYYYRKKKKRT